MKINKILFLSLFIGALLFCGVIATISNFDAAASAQTKENLIDTMCCGDDTEYVSLESTKYHFSNSENIMVSYYANLVEHIVDISYSQVGFTAISATVDPGDPNRIIVELSCDPNAESHSMSMQIHLSSNNKLTAMLYAITNEYGTFVSPFSEDDAFEIYLEYALESNIYTEEECENIRATFWKRGIIEESYVEKSSSIGGKTMVYTSTATSSETLIKGLLQWKDDNGNIHQLRRVMVKIYDKEGIGASEITTVYSDNTGNFTYIFDNVDGIFENNGADIFIRVYAGTDNAMVKNRLGVKYYYESCVSENIISGTTLIKNMTIDMTSDLGRAFQISQAVLTARDYAWIMMDEMPGDVTVRYPYNGDNCNYDNVTKRINITSKVRENDFVPHSYASWDVIMHEYGHHISFELDIVYNTIVKKHKIGSNLCDEFENKRRGIRIAWAEAWPTFFGMLAQDYYRSYLGNVVSVNNGNYDAYNFRYSVPIEINAIYPLGDACEASIIAVLWDIFDSNNDVYDTISLGHNEAWAVTTRSKTFSDFIGYFYDQYPSYIDDIGMNLSYYNMATSIPVMTDSLSVSETRPPKFTWKAQGGSQQFPNNSFVLIFYDDSGAEILRTSAVTSNWYRLSSNEWSSIVSNGGTFTLAIAATQTSKPLTGEYISARSEAFTIPTADMNESDNRFIYVLLDDDTYAVASRYQNLEGDLIIPSEYKGKAITKIYDYGFDECVGLSSVVLPSSLKIIGDGAFQNCTALQSIEISHGLISIGASAFSGCSVLESIDLPNSLINIGNSAFYGCSALEIIDLPNSLTNIGEGAFRDCESLEIIELPDGITDIGLNTFSGCTSMHTIELPDNLISIGFWAFRGCTSLETIEFPDSLTSIEGYAFEGCSNLQIISFGSCLNQISYRVFKDCTALTSVYIPASVSDIGAGVFAGCNNLESINVDPDNQTYHSEGNCIISGDTLIMGCKNSIIPNYVKNIYYGAFQGLTVLSHINIPNTVTHLDDEVFSGCSGLTSISLPLQGENENYAWESFCELFGDYAYSVPTSLKTVNIINGTEIPQDAFMDCVNIRTVNLPESLVRINNNAFSGCEGIERIVLPEGLMYIGAAFIDCSSLLEITIPSSVATIEGEAFWGCENLHFVEILRSVSMGSLEIGSAAFGTSSGLGCPNLEIVSVPDEETCNHLSVFPYKDFYTYPSRIEYSLLSDGTYELSYATPNTSGEIIIPEIYNGKPVTKIGNGAFYGCEYMTSIILPKTIVEIGEYAFYGCRGLTVIDIQRHASMGITVINDSSIGSSGLRMLEAILVPDYISLYAYGNAYGAIDHLFVYNDFSYDYLGGIIHEDNTITLNIWEELSEEEREGITELYIPAYIEGCPVTKIADEGFAGLVNLEVVYFCSGGNIVEIGDRAFAGCTALTFIELPYSVEYIGEDAFAGTSLPSINLRSTMEVEQGAFGQDVTIYTDAASAPESWEFLDGHYVFWNCILAESRNYVEFIFGQSRGDYLGVINTPHKQGALGCVWSTNGKTVLIDYYNGELVAYLLDHIVDDEYYLGAKIQAFYASMF